MADINQLLTECDALLGGMDADLGRATERHAVKDYVASQFWISAAHSKLGGAGAALAAVAKAFNSAGPVPNPEPEPGEPTWTGNIDPLSLTPVDLAFWQHWCYPSIAGKVFIGTQFTGEVSKARYNTWIGRDYEAAKALSPAQTANYVGVLASFKGKQLGDL